MPHRPDASPRLTRRAFAGLLLAAGAAATLTGDRAPALADAPLSLRLDDPDLERYLRALRDLPAATRAHLTIAAAVLDPGTNPLRGMVGNLPVANARAAAYRWTYRAEARRMSGILADVERLYGALLPADRARHYAALLRGERARLDGGAQVDYAGLAHLVTRVNREQGLMARPEFADLALVRQHRLDPRAQPRGVPALLAERRERRDLAAAFGGEAARLLAGAPLRAFVTPAGPLTLLAALGRPAGTPGTYQIIRAVLPDLDDATLAAHAVLYTAGDFLALEPATPPGRWADGLPADQRALAPANALSPRLGRAALLDPAHASRVLWASLPECRAIVADLRAL